MSVIPESHADLLTKPVFWHIATNGPARRAPVEPGLGRLGRRALHVLAHQGRQKYENLVKNPTIALSGIDPDNSYRYMEIRGTVVRIDDDSSNTFIDSMAKKYMGVDGYPFHQEGDHRVVMVVQPMHTTQMG